MRKEDISTKGCIVAENDIWWPQMVVDGRIAEQKKKDISKA